MEAGQATAAPRAARRVPSWLAGLLPLLVLGGAIAIFVALDAPGLERNGVPVEEVAVEKTVLRPGEIELIVRNDGPDAVQIRQATVNDAFTAFTQTSDEIGRLGASTITIDYPWIEGQAYEVALVTATGGTAATAIDVAAETPQTGAGFFGLMALVGLYVGVIPVAIGMLWLPWIRSIDPRYVQFLLALTVGLLAFLGVDALLEGTEFAGSGSQAFGGAALVYLGALTAYLALVGVDSKLKGRTQREKGAGAGAWRLAFLIALGIGLHNLGEGLAIGSSYAIGSLALGVTLIVGFALHNTTEGLAIVAPVARGEEGEPGGGALRLRRLVGLGLLAGLPAVVGAWIGASAFNPSLAAFMFGLGAGAIAQVIVQIAPSVRDSGGRLLHPLAVAGLLTGLVLMYATGLLVSV
ncbi:MAG: ZIP family metal transporter [Actinomycetota bacterium]|nr:ZIP family metal transporter [Actinomycetota bacterium]